MRPTLLKEDYQNFKNKYEGISGLSLPLEYLDTSDVYVFRKAKKIIGGFILGKKLPLRTVDIFISELNKEKFKHFFSSDKCCEVCCFWIDRKYRRSAFFNAKFWIKMANTVERQEKEFILYGTNSKGLAKMYGYPKASALIHKDKMDNRETFTFLARRRDFVRGTWQIIKSKMLNQDRKSDFEIENKLKKELIYEVSR